MTFAKIIASTNPNYGPVSHILNLVDEVLSQLGKRYNTAVELTLQERI